MNGVYLALVVLGIVTVAETACPDNWESHGTHCYHFSHDKEKWFDALGMCNAILGGDLIEIGDAAENAFVRDQLALRGKGYASFMALSDVVSENVWMWMVSDTMLGAGSYSNWSMGQPDNHGGQQNCGAVGVDGAWRDAACASLHYYVCEKSDAGGIIVG